MGKGLSKLQQASSETLEEITKKQYKFGEDEVIHVEHKVGGRCEECISIGRIWDAREQKDSWSKEEVLECIMWTNKLYLSQLHI